MTNPLARFAITAVALLLPALMAHAYDVSSVSSTWELKGLKLGMTQADVLAAFPASECQTFQPGVVMCIDKTAALAGGPANVVTKFLDDKLIAISVNEVSPEQASAAANALTEKYGPNTRAVKSKHHNAKGQGYFDSEQLIWEDKAAGVEMYVEPYDYYNNKVRHHRSSVDLLMGNVHDNVWLPRAKSPDATVAPDI